MKKFLAIIILSLCFITPSQANDIRDFQIEGMSIGDSLLNIFSLNQLKEFTNHSSTFNYKDGKSKIITTHSDAPIGGRHQSSTYSFVGVTFNDKINYKIIGIQGHISFKEVGDCNKERLKIEKEIENLLNIQPKRQTAKHAYDNTSQSFTSWFHFDTNDSISINCTDWQKKFNWPPNLKVSIISTELKEVLRINYE